MFDKDHSNLPIDERNGFVYHQANNPGIESALHRAIGLWYAFPDDFHELMMNGMSYDFSWNYPGQHYMQVYDFIRYK